MASELKQREAIARGEWDRSWVPGAVSLVHVEQEAYSA